MGGPATVGLTQLWRKATERLPVPWRMMSTSQLKLCDKMALLLLA